MEHTNGLKTKTLKGMDAYQMGDELRRVLEGKILDDSADVTEAMLHILRNTREDVDVKWVLENLLGLLEGELLELHD